MSVAVDSFVFHPFSQSDTNRTVARRGQHVISASEFVARLNVWRCTFDEIANTAVALYEPDGVEFAAALVGAWSAGKTVYLPGDIQPETCRALQTLNVAFVGAFPDGFETLTSRAATLERLLEPLDADDITVIIFTSGSSGAPQAVPKRLSQLLAEVHTLEKTFGARIGNSDMVATVSHQHIYGLLFKILCWIFTKVFIILWK